MPKYGGSWKAAVDDNSRKACAVLDCFRNRYMISKHCLNHKHAQWLWGAAEYRAINKKDFISEEKEVSDIVRLNLDHPGIERGLSFFETWLKAAHAGIDSVPCPELIGRLYEAEVSPIDLLTRAATIWLFTRRRPGRILTKRNEDHVTGNFIIRIIPYHTHIKGPHMRRVGEYIRDNIGVLLINICRSADRKEMEQRQNLKEQYQELKI